MVGAEKFAFEMFPQLKDSRYPALPDELIFLHAEEILDMYPDLPRKQRETASFTEVPSSVHHRHWLAVERRLPARDARRRLRRLGDEHERGDRDNSRTG